MFKEAAKNQLDKKNINITKSSNELTTLNNEFSKINTLKEKLDTLAGLAKGTITPDAIDIPKRTILLNAVSFIPAYEKENLLSIFTDQPNLVSKFKVETSPEGLSEIYNPVMDKRSSKIASTISDEKVKLIDSFRLLALDSSIDSSYSSALIKEYN